MDLTLASTIARDSGYGLVNPHTILQEHIDARFTTEDLPGRLLETHRYILWTNERVEIPPDTIGLIGIRHTYASWGILAPTTIADPGYYGTLTVAVYNCSRSDIWMEPGDRVITMHLVKIQEGSEDLYNGRYQGQKGLQLPKPLRG